MNIILRKLWIFTSVIYCDIRKKLSLTMYEHIYMWSFFILISIMCFEKLRLFSEHHLAQMPSEAFHKL